LRESVQTGHQRTQPRRAQLALDQTVLLLGGVADEHESSLARG